MEVENKSAKPVLQKGSEGSGGRCKAFFITYFSFLPFSYSRPLREPKKKRVMLTGKRWGRMNTQLLLEEKHVFLKNEFGGKLQKKRVLELEITRQFEELKKLEVSLEKRAHLTTAEG